MINRDVWAKGNISVNTGTPFGSDINIDYAQISTCLPNDLQKYWITNSSIAQISASFQNNIITLLSLNMPIINASKIINNSSEFVDY